MEIDGQGGNGSRKEEGGGGVGATTQQRTSTTMDKTRNNQTERGKGWRKTAVAMATIVSLVNTRVQWWTLWVGWP
jgi:hypothetical protein